MAVNNDFLPYAESFYETTLTQSITASQSTCIVATAPTNQTGYLVIEPNSSNREIIRFTAASGTTLTIVRGCSETSNVDDSAGTGVAHPAGAQVAMKDVHYYFNKIIAAFRGANASGFNSWAIGDGNTISAANRFFNFNTSSLSAYIGLNTAGKFVFSEDGVTSYTLSSGGSGVAAGSGVAITAGVMDVTLLSTGGLQMSGTKLAIKLADSSIVRSSAGLSVDYSAAGITIEALSGTTADAVSAFFNPVSISPAQASSLVNAALLSNSYHYHGVWSGSSIDFAAISATQYRFFNTGFRPGHIWGVGHVSVAESMTVNYGGPNAAPFAWDLHTGGHGSLMPIASITVVNTFLTWLVGASTFYATLDSTTTSGFTMVLSGTHSGGTTEYWSILFNAQG